MDVVNQPALPPGASSEGVGRGRCARVLFNSADRPRKLPSILPSIEAASFWLIVAFKIIERRPFKTAVYFILYIFVDQFAAPHDGMVSPHALPAQRASALTPPLPLTATIGLIVV